MSIERISSNVIKVQPNELNTHNHFNEERSEISNVKSSEKEHEVSKERLKNVITVMNEFLLPTNTSLKFEMHEELKKYFVKIVDSSTQEVVREIPPKKLLDMYAEMTRFVGLLVDKKI